MTLITNEARHALLSRLSGVVSIEGEEGDKLTVTYQFSGAEEARATYYKLFEAQA